MGYDTQDPNRLIVGKAYDKFEKPEDIRDITMRVVKLERTLTGKADQYNIYPVVPLGGVVYVSVSASAAATSPVDWWAKCDNSVISANGSPFIGNTLPNLSGTFASGGKYWGYMRIK